MIPLSMQTILYYQITSPSELLPLLRPHHKKFFIIQVPLVPLAIWFHSTILIQTLTRQYKNSYSSKTVYKINSEHKTPIILHYTYKNSYLAKFAFISAWILISALMMSANTTVSLFLVPPTTCKSSYNFYQYFNLSYKA